MDLKETKQLLDFLVDSLREADLTEIEISKEGQRIRIKREASSAVAHATASTPISSREEIPEERGRIAKTRGYVFKSPLIGHVYLAPSPNEKPYVTVGQKVESGDIVCIVEAMKIMNHIEIDQGGTIKRILVENGATVDCGTELFELEALNE